MALTMTVMGKLYHRELFLSRDNFSRVLSQHCTYYSLNLSEFGELLKLPTNEVTYLLETIITQSGEKAKGFVISGFPRDISDLQSYLERLGKAHQICLFFAIKMYAMRQKS